ACGWPASTCTSRAARPSRRSAIAGVRRASRSPTRSIGSRRMATADAARARARANFALVKYWGKADARLNVPAVGSISITLDALWTDTSVAFDPTLDRDELSLDGAPARERDRARASAFLDLVRERAGVRMRARIESRNNFPTGAGLASSASGFAAL